MLRFFWLSMLLLTLTGCGSGDDFSSGDGADDSPPIIQVEATDAERELALTATSEFGVAFYKQLATEQPDENLFFSPFSMSTALTIALEGAVGETAEEMGAVLGVPQSLSRGGKGGDKQRWTLDTLHRGLANLNARQAPPAIPAGIRAELKKMQAQLDDANRRIKESRGSDKQASREGQAAADRINEINKQIDHYELRIANTLWTDKHYAFRREYLDTIAKYYGSVVKPTDFRADADAARRQINELAAKQTAGRVKEVLPPSAVTGDTRLVIANAVYFKGQWVDPFEADSSRPELFHLSSKDTFKTPTMRQWNRDSASYAAFNGDGSFFTTPTEIPIDMKDDDPSLYPADDGFAMLSLDYKGGAMSMVWIVPRSADGLPDLDKLLSGERLQKWLGQLKRRTVNLYVPRFKLVTEYQLNDPLQTLGMRRAFSSDLKSGAQFDAMTTVTDANKGLFISTARQKTFVEVNEKGTEAAAVTVISLGDKSAAPGDRDPPKTRPFVPIFRADRPFIVIIKHRDGGVLFLGRIVKPEAGSAAE